MPVFFFFSSNDVFGREISCVSFMVRTIELTGDEAPLQTEPLIVILKIVQLVEPSCSGNFQGGGGGWVVSW